MEVVAKGFPYTVDAHEEVSPINLLLYFPARGIVPKVCSAPERCASCNAVGHEKSIYRDGQNGRSQTSEWQCTACWALHLKVQGVWTVRVLKKKKSCKPTLC
jgi:hypothetical protein